MYQHFIHYFEEGHHYSQSDLVVSDRRDILKYLDSPDVKKTLVLCCPDIKSLLDEIHNMKQVLEIYVCNIHFPMPPGVSLRQIYPKVTLIRLDDSMADWKSTAYHNIAMSYEFVNEHFAHVDALKRAFQAAQERDQNQ
ncbi:unnamed protein product [Rotaria socialis]|uniref:Uncharacterized protein n=1 Tax=Rotaria socialis TaxID=392032 RepID=A0A821EDH1_9BILA|nr:unnamed protein product [Rotaria socialis]CAF4634668.1 unnamed protein product [Rotaria socialis]